MNRQSESPLLHFSSRIWKSIWCYFGDLTKICLLPPLEVWGKPPGISRQPGWHHWLIHWGNLNRTVLQLVRWYQENLNRTREKNMWLLFFVSDILGIQDIQDIQESRWSADSLGMSWGWSISQTSPGLSLATAVFGSPVAKTSSRSPELFSDGKTPPFEVKPWLHSCYRATFWGSWVIFLTEAG